MCLWLGKYVIFGLRLYRDKAKRKPIVILVLTTFLWVLKSQCLKNSQKRDIAIAARLCLAED